MSRMGSRWDRETRKDPREMALMKALGEVIKREWNPLGRTEPGVAYDSYIPGIQGLLLGRTDKSQLAWYLFQLES